MNDLLFDYLDDFYTAYLDDILIYLEDPLEHKAQVKVLDRLCSAGLQVDINKYEFNMTRTTYLGFIVLTKGIKVDEAKVEVVKNQKELQTVKGVQSFLRFYNFYRRFITNYSRVAKPLNYLTKKKTPFKQIADYQEVFNQLKATILTTPILQHYYPDRLTTIETDTSDGVIGVVILQQDPKSRLQHPIAYFSKTIQAAELNYDIYNKEMLAIIQSLIEWRPWLQGLQTEEPFLLYSDHRSLEYFMTTKKLSSRQARWAELLSRYYFRLQYRVGKANTRANALSRKAEDVTAQQKVIEQYYTQIMIPRQKIDQAIVDDLQLAPLEEHGYNSLRLISRILEDNRTNPDIQDLWTKAQTEQTDNTQSLRDGLLLRHDKLYVTDSTVDGVLLRTVIIREAYKQPLLGYLGQTKLRQLLQARYYWLGQGSDID